jgi:4'-phosphopantetheinyl transferase
VQLAQTLSADEIERADKYHFELDKSRLIARRGLLRKVVGFNLGIDPAAVQFCYHPKGKPSVAGTCGRDSLCFSLSQSNGLALYAIAWNCEVGVDLEMLRPLDDADEIAERFFSTEEIHAIHKLPRGQEIHGFLNCWTRKEAYLKATGFGLTRPLEDVIVSLAPGEPAKLLSVAGNPDEPSRWSLLALEPAPGYVAAICVEA